MMDSTTEQLPDALLDAAACEAVGANTPTDSAAYHGQLVSAGAQGRQLDRAMRETAAHLAAASPYLAPPADLRGRILQATAPRSFRLEDYRKAMRDNSRYYRWGVAAAMVFLMAAAWYNMTLQASLKKMTDNAVALQNSLKTTSESANEALARADNEIKQRDLAVRTLGVTLGRIVSADSKQVNLMSNGRLAAKVFLNDQTNEAVLFVPQGAVPVNSRAPIMLTLKDQSGKVVKQYKTILVEGGVGQGAVNPQERIANDVTIQNPQPVGSTPIMQAAYPIGQ